MGDHRDGRGIRAGLVVSMEVAGYQGTVDLLYLLRLYDRLLTTLTECSAAVPPRVVVLRSRLYRLLYLGGCTLFPARFRGCIGAPVEEENEDEKEKRGELVNYLVMVMGQPAAARSISHRMSHRMIDIPHGQRRLGLNASPGDHGPIVCSLMDAFDGCYYSGPVYSTIPPGWLALASLVPVSSSTC